MKITEVLANDSQALFEVLDAANDTGFLAEDLVKVVESQNGPWTEPMTGDEFSIRLAEMAAKNGITI